MVQDRKRWWFRFSLRSLFLLITAVAVAIGYPAWKARERNEIIETLKRSGARVWLAHEGRANVPAPGLGFLKHYLGEYAFSKVTRIEACGDWVTDYTLGRIATAIPELDWLHVESKTLTTKGSRSLSSMKLRILVLSRDKRSSQNVDDSWMPELATLTQVKYLYLDGARITDDGVAQLRGATGLREIGLTQTDVTAKGVEDLKNALPNCRVFWNPPSRVAAGETRGH